MRGEVWLWQANRSIVRSTHTLTHWISWEKARNVLTEGDLVRAGRARRHHNNGWTCRLGELEARRLQEIPSMTCGVRCTWTSLR